MTVNPLYQSNDVAPILSIAQQEADHRAIVEGYLNTHKARNHTWRTLRSDQSFIERWFRVQGSPQCPMFIWEAMAPIRGREHIQEYLQQVVKAKSTSASTLANNLGRLRRLFEYVVKWPYIPNSGGVSIAKRYGPVEQPILSYDYPIHTWAGRKEDKPLNQVELTTFYETIRTKVIPNARRPWVAARNYTMVVIAGESGLRIQEICHLEHKRDLLFIQNRIQTRAGKGHSGSGPKVRQTIFTPFAQATVRHYLKSVRPQFKRWSQSPFLFLTEQGTKLNNPSAAAVIRAIAKITRKENLRIPPRFGWHSLRRSFATIQTEENPDQIWVVMKMLGHENPNTISSYVHHHEAYFDNVMDRIISRLIPEG